MNSEEKSRKKHKGLSWLSVNEASEAVSKWPEWKKKAGQQLIEYLRKSREE